MSGKPSFGDFVGKTVSWVLRIVLNGLVVWWLWNRLVPSIFNLRLISYWEAMGFILLVSSLVWAFRE